MKNKPRHRSDCFVSVKRENKMKKGNAPLKTPRGAWRRPVECRNLSGLIYLAGTAGGPAPTLGLHISCVMPKSYLLAAIRIDNVRLKSHYLRYSL